MDDSSILNLTVVLFFFNRPDCLRKVFKEVRIAKPSRIILVQDGPRVNNQDDIILINKCREIVYVDWECEVIYDYSQINLSAHRRIFTGISNAFNYCESLMCLEDDCIPSQSYFKFCSELLEKYKDDERIHYINGLNRIEDFDNTPYSYFFSMQGTGFGLATWKRVWDQVKINSSLDFLDDENTIRSLRLLIKNIYPKSYKRHITKAIHIRKANLKLGFMSSWELPFGITQTINSSYTITPKYTMFEYIGIGNDATYSGNSINYLPKRYQKLLTPQKKEISFPISHPKFVHRDIKYEIEHDRIFYKSITTEIIFKIEIIIRRIIFGKFHENFGRFLKKIKSYVIS